MGVQKSCAEFLVQRLAGSGSRVTVNTMEMWGDAANKCGLQDRAVALAFVFAKNGIRVAVDGLRIARAAGHFVLPIQSDSVGFADQPASFKHPDNDGAFEQMLLLRQREPQVGMILALKRHSALDGIVRSKRNSHGVILDLRWRHARMRNAQRIIQRLVLAPQAADNRTARHFLP